jgi:hypothetical protein
MGRVPYSEFIDSRARFQRLSDQRVFSGWVQTLRNDCVSLTTEEPLPFGPGERFLFQVQGPSADAYFLATSSEIALGIGVYVNGSTANQVVELPALNHEFKLITAIQMRDAQQLARKWIQTMAANLHAGGRTSEVLISDASGGGMGVFSWQELQKGDVVGIDIQSKEFQANFMCEVRHCRPEPRLVGAYRVGLQFQKPDRVALTAWRKLINPL